MPKGFMPITKRTNANWQHSGMVDSASPQQIEVLINSCGYSPEKAKTLNKNQAADVIAAYASRNGRPTVPRTNLVKSGYVRTKR